ncbi:MAG: hypothetical protein AUG51_16010 [Acidobacteria bacterium 13_1_20CM_3_53_8]|nr:MAG: hypothetical protein AUG51_16010 [Acidobacteria bacterium 13_1_20CM_3_53_8]
MGYSRIMEAAPERLAMLEAPPIFSRYPPLRQVHAAPDLHQLSVGEKPKQVTQLEVRLHEPCEQPFHSKIAETVIAD